MLISASYFWSDALNAFMFNHGPMTPTLMDVVMLTGLNIHASNKPFHLVEKASFKIETKSIGRWKGYIGKNMKTESLSVREHTAFLNMWLEKFIFCGKAVGPTNNNLKLAENLATGNHVPLGKHLMGSVYHLLHQVSSRLRKNQPITNLGGPWWFIQLWLHMYMHKTMVVELSETELPSENFSEGEETITGRCTSFGEAAIMIANDHKVLGITDFFKCFYNDFPETSTICFAYQDEKVINENPFKLQFDSWKTDEEATKIMKEIISPRILPANFTFGKEIPSYEFYNLSVAARQLGFSQVPPLPFFVGKFQFRGALNSALSYDRLKNLEPEVDVKALADWQVVPFITTPFIQWWSEWQEHIFCKTVNLYCIALNENYQAANNEVQNQTHSLCRTIMFSICIF